MGAPLCGKFGSSVVKVPVSISAQVAEIAHADLDLLVARLEQAIAALSFVAALEIGRGLGADVLEARGVSASQLLTVSSKPSISLMLSL